MIKLNREIKSSSCCRSSAAEESARGSAELIRVVRKGDEKGVEKEREESERGVRGGEGREPP